MTYAAVDLYEALRNAEQRCRGMHGPALERFIDGWEASASVRDGRRFARAYRSGVHPSPVDALNTLTERIAKGEG